MNRDLEFRGPPNSRRRGCYRAKIVTKLGGFFTHGNQSYTLIRLSACSKHGGGTLKSVKKFINIFNNYQLVYYCTVSLGNKILVTSFFFLTALSQVTCFYVHMYVPYRIQSRVTGHGSFSRTLYIRYICGGLAKSVVIW